MMEEAKLRSLLAAERREDDVLDAGIELLKEIGGAGALGPVSRVAELSSAAAALTVAVPYGSVLSRPGLPLRERQLCTVGILLAQGSATAQLAFHMRGALNVGATSDDIVDLLTTAAGTLGFPAAISGTAVLRNVLAEAPDRPSPSTSCPEPSGTEEDFTRRGATTVRDLYGIRIADLLDRTVDDEPELARRIIAFEFGEAAAAGRLEPRARRLATIAMLGSAGNLEDRLTNLMNGALAMGTSAAEICEVLLQLAIYAGFPKALNAFAAFERASQLGHEAVGNRTSDLPPPAVACDRRRATGLATLAATSKGAGQSVIDGFAGIAPRIGEMIVDHAYGEVFSAKDLDPRTRELTACAALAARLGEVDEGPLGVHAAAARAAGASEAEIVGTILNLAPYVGYPRVQAALSIVRDAVRQATATVPS